MGAPFFVTRKRGEGVKGNGVPLAGFGAGPQDLTPQAKNYSTKISKN